jgi:mannosyltransferase OCH1-like enzyme
MSDMQTDLDATNKTIRGVWFASELTAIQQLCIKSYMDHGHEFHLYVAGPTKGVPEGTIVEDANAYVSASERKKFPHNSQAADLCRVLVVLEEGGWYVDLDTVCLRPFDFPEPYVFVSEDPSKYGKQKSTKIPLTPCLETVTNSIPNNIFKAPVGSPFLQHIADRIRSSDTLNPGYWTVFGPDLFMEAIPKFHLEQYVKAPIVLDAANPNELYHLVDGNVRYNISEKSYAMHFRTSWWSGLFQPSLSAVHHPDSQFEQLKRKHYVATSGPC